MNDVVCTLFENDFHHGLAALINSLHHSDFSGEIVAGYRGHLPDWAQVFTQSHQPLTHKIRLTFEKPETDFHFTHYKPTFFLKIAKERQFKHLFYFDPDITLRAPWSFMTNWAKSCVAVCQDVNNLMPSNHPIKLAWKKTALEIGEKINIESDFFYNAGFLGIPASHQGFLSLWEKLIKNVWSEEELKHFCPPHRNTRLDPFCIADQDAFNLALMIFDGAISSIGPDGMDFTNGGCIMSHAIGSPKPWNKNFITMALSGMPPSKADKFFLQFAQQGPIFSMSKNQLRKKQINLKLATLIGRFIRRN
jgi:lipopolysaccharide biosynthesis glycosyltransferase